MIIDIIGLVSTICAAVFYLLLLLYLTFVFHSYFAFSSATQLYLTLCNLMDYSTSGFPSITNSRSLLKLMSIKLVMPSNYLILCHILPVILVVFCNIWY